MLISVVFLFIALFSNLHSDELNDSSQSNEWKRVYLATFPRSGNHWMRFLLEEASHIATSSVYIDRDRPERHPKWINPTHLDMPFPWGGYCPKNGYTGRCRYPTKDDIVVIKTHFPVFKSAPFDGKYSFLNVRIIRNPIDSCWSMFIYSYKDKNYPDIVPHDFVLLFIKLWQKFQEYWNHNINCVSVYYEDLLESPKEVLSDIMSIMGYQVSNEDIERAVAKFPPKNKELQHLDHFKKEDLELMKVELNDLMVEFGYQIP